MQKPKSIERELAVIGCGMAGMAAAVFATARGVPVVQIGNSSEILFASGYMDLMGVYPIADKQIWENPWEAISMLHREAPMHPYARIPEPDIRSSVNEFFSFTEKIGIPYCREMERNCRMLTPMGTLKPTYGVPETMWNSVAALQKQSKLSAG